MFTSDELPHYKTILSEIYSEEIPAEKSGKKGRPPKPVRRVDPELDYATVDKTRENGKVIKVERRIVYGDQKRIEERIAQGPGKKINTSYIERFNGTARQNDAHLRRKSMTFAKEIPYFNPFYSPFFRQTPDIKHIALIFAKISSNRTTINNFIKIERFIFSL